ncbi:carboxypeptidase regulatory-like domain-containing protein [Candidatus Margulisiibacteriota bacterium]
MFRKMYFWLAAVLLIAVSLLVYGCGSASVTGEEGIITGTIYAADGETAIVGATVYLKSDSTKSTTTDINGEFTLEGDWIVAGTYTLVASKGEFILEFSVTVAESGSTTDGGSQEVTPTDPNATIPDIGVVLKDSGSDTPYDYIQDIITDLGYSYTTIEVSDFDDYDYISTFEVIFINCSHYAGTALTASGEANLLSFVETAGQSLYISDWAATYVQEIWPNAVTWYGSTVSNAKVGNIQTLETTVVDTDLQTVLGKSTAEVYYNLSSWVVISSEGTGTSVLLSGDPTVYSAYSVNAAQGSRSRSGMKAASDDVAATLDAVPLVVKFQPGGASKGTVIYTTFHNEAQEDEVTADARKILQDFIFSL